MESKGIMMPLLGLVILSGSLQAQGRKDLLRFQGNLAGGYRFSDKVFTSYVQGDAEYFLHDLISVGGQVWYGFPLAGDPLRNNHSLLAGFTVHPVRRGFVDPYVAFHPGVSLAGEWGRASGLVPVISFSGGVNFYTGPLFHLFLRAQGVTAHFAGGGQTGRSLHEIRVSAGLGYHFSARKGSR